MNTEETQKNDHSQTSSTSTTKKKRGKGSAFDKYCFLRSNQKLRDIIKLRVARDRIMLYRVARIAGFRGSDLKRYLSGEDPKAISQYNLWKFCQMIGINVELVINLQDEYNSQGIRKSA